MEKVIEVNGKSFKVTEMLAKDFDSINWDNKPEALKKQVIFSTNISESDYDNLTIKERLIIMTAITELNGFNDFQQPTK